MARNSLEGPNKPQGSEDQAAKLRALSQQSIERAAASAANAVPGTQGPSLDTLPIQDDEGLVTNRRRQGKTKVAPSAGPEVSDKELEKAAKKAAADLRKAEEKEQKAAEKIAEKELKETRKEAIEILKEVPVTDEERERIAHAIQFGQSTRFVVGGSPNSTPANRVNDSVEWRDSEPPEGASADAGDDLTPAERAQIERGKLKDMVSKFKELMKKPGEDDGIYTPQDVLRERKEERASVFAEQFGMKNERENLKAIGDELKEEYKKFYGSIGAAAREKVGAKPKSLVEAEKKFADASSNYGSTLLQFADSKRSEGYNAALKGKTKEERDALRSAADFTYKRAVAFNLRDTVSGREELRLAARESALNEKGKMLLVKAMGRISKGYIDATNFVGRGVAAAQTVIGSKNLEEVDRAKFERDAARYGGATRLLSTAVVGSAIMSATPLAALGFGGNVLWRLGRGAIGSIAGAKLGAASAKFWKEKVESGNAYELTKFRTFNILPTPENMLAFQESYRKNNVAARRKRSATVAFMGSLIGGGAATGAIIGGEVGGKAAFSAVFDKGDAVNTIAAPRPSAPVGERAPVTASAESAPRAESVTAPAPVAETSPVQTPEASVVPTPAPEAAPAPATAPATPESAPAVAAATETEPKASETVPAAAAEVESNAPVASGTAPNAPEAPATPEAATKPESVAVRGDGYDRMFERLKEQLEAQYKDVAPSEIPPTAQHILAADHPNELSREFGFAWGDATDNSASAPVEIGDALALEDGKLVLRSVDGTERELLSATGEKTFTYEHGAAPEQTPETPAAQPGASEPAPSAAPEADQTPRSVTPEPTVAETPPPAPNTSEVNMLEFTPPTSEQAPVTPPTGNDGVMTLDEYRARTQVPEAPSAPQAPIEASTVFSNINNVEIDPKAPALYNWRVPGSGVNVLLAHGAGAEQFAERAVRSLDPGTYVLYDHVTRNPLTGLETHEVQGVRMVNGQLERSTGFYGPDRQPVAPPNVNDITSKVTR